MGMHATLAAASSAAVIATGDAVTFSGAIGDVSTYATIVKQQGIVVGAVQIGDPRMVCTLLTADVGAAARGDTITRTSDGTSWTLQEAIDPTNEHVQTWSIEES